MSGTPTLSLSNGATASYSSGSGSTTLVFQYTVVEGDSDSSDLSVSSYSGSIADAAGNAADAVSGDLGDVKIDANRPTLNTITLVSNNTDTSKAMHGNEITLQFTASETISHQQ